MVLCSKRKSAAKPRHFAVWQVFVSSICGKSLYVDDWIHPFASKRCKNFASIQQPSHCTMVRIESSLIYPPYFILRRRTWSAGPWPQKSSSKHDHLLHHSHQHHWAHHTCPSPFHDGLRSTRLSVWVEFKLSPFWFRNTSYFQFWTLFVLHRSEAAEIQFLSCSNALPKKKIFPLHPTPGTTTASSWSWWYPMRQKMKDMMTVSETL